MARNSNSSCFGPFSKSHADACARGTQEGNVLPSPRPGAKRGNGPMVALNYRQVDAERATGYMLPPNEPIQA